VPLFLRPPPVDVDRELAAMRAELSEIRASMRDGWLDEVRAEQVRAIVRDALADSSVRTSFSDGASNVGFDSQGAYVRSDDGLMTLAINICDQVRFVASSAYGSPSGPGDTNTRWGLENKLVFMTAMGTIYDPSLTYLAAVAYTTQSNRFIEVPGSLRVVYAQLKKDLGEGWNFGIGLLNVPFDVESEYAGSSLLTSGDWSIFNYRFGTGKQPGLGLRWQGSKTKFYSATYSQINSLDEAWNSAANLSFAVAGRFDVLVDGSWEQLERMSGAPDDPHGIVLGIGACMSNGRAQNPSSPPTPSAQGMTADVIARISGLNLEAQVAYMRDAAGAPELGWSTGTQFQAALFLTDKLETFVQACWMDTSDVPWIAQAGFNYYFARSRLKFTTKVFVPFGGGNINGIGQLSGGLGMQSASNNASFVAQIQMMW
jgi:hypothetical protein